MPKIKLILKNLLDPSLLANHFGSAFWLGAREDFPDIVDGLLDALVEVTLAAFTLGIIIGFMVAVVVLLIQLTI